ncbi:retrovirus-related pol polyprotein from transposon TNT 1-94 [Tanacetum coccineum]
MSQRAVSPPPTIAWTLGIMMLVSERYRDGAYFNWRTPSTQASKGLRNANHTQTLDLADIYEGFVYEDNLIQRRSSEEYLRDLDIEYHERALLANSKRFIKRRNNFSGQKANENTECYKRGNKGHFARDCFSKTYKPSYKSPVNNYSSVSKGFQPKFTPKHIQSSSNLNNQADPKFQKDYKAKYKKMKARLALFEDEEEVSNEEEVPQVKVLMALADEELIVGKSHARNGEWVDITIRKVNTLLSMDEDADWQNYLKYINTDLKFVEEQRLNLLSKYNKMVFELNKCRDELLILKQAKLDAVTFQIQNTELTKLNHALQEQLKEEKKINEKWLTCSKKVSQCMGEQIPHQKKKVLGGELVTESSSKMNENKNLFVPASIGYDQEMVSKTKDWVERLNPNSKLPNFNTGRILVPESQAINESLEPTKTLRIVAVSKTKQTTPSVPTEVKDTEQESKLNELTKLVQMLIDKKGDIWYLDSRCSRSMNGVKSYLHKYVEQPGPKVVFGDNSSCITEGYGSINYGGIVFTKVAFVNGLKYNLISISQLCDAKYIVQFDDKQGTIFVLIAPRRNDVYVLDMSSLTLNGACFFAKASESVNWLWHKRLSHINFKNINKLAKQNKVLGLPSLVYSKDKPCTTCEKGKHYRASFKTKRNFSIRKCLHLLHMDLFGPVIAAPIISISSDSFEESVGSHAPRVILFGAIPAIIPIIPEVPIVPADPIAAPKDSLPPAPDLPLVLPFLCSDDLEADGASEPAEQRHVSTLRRSEAFRRWRSAPLSTPYPPTTSESSLGSSFKRSLDSSSPSSRPSLKRCRSPTASVPSPTHVSRSIDPTPADLLPPHKRFRDSYSIEDSEEKHMEVDTADAEAVADVGISEGAIAHPEDGVGIRFEIVASDIWDDDEEFEAEASAADTREIAVDPLANGDSSEFSRGGIPDLEDTIYDIVHYMSEVRIDRITKIETTQRQLEASQLVASGERASLVERIGSLWMEYLKVRAMLSIERDRIDCLHWHMALSQEEFFQFHRDHDDTRRRLRRLESYVERHLGFRP